MCRSSHGAAPETAAQRDEGRREDGAVTWVAAARRTTAAVEARAKTAARSFYVGVLGGRQVWPTAHHRPGRRLWFLVSGRLVEVKSEAAHDEESLLLHVDDPDAVAERAWNAGFSVRVREEGSGEPPLSVTDPFGRRIDLALATGAARARAGGEVQR